MKFFQFEDNPLKELFENLKIMKKYACLLLLGNSYSRLRFNPESGPDFQNLKSLTLVLFENSTSFDFFLPEISNIEFFAIVQFSEEMLKKRNR